MYAPVLVKAEEATVSWVTVLQLPGLQKDLDRKLTECILQLAAGLWESPLSITTSQRFCAYLCRWESSSVS